MQHGGSSPFGVAADAKGDARTLKPLSRFEPDRITDADYAAAVRRGIDDLRRFDGVRDMGPEGMPPSDDEVGPRGRRRSGVRRLPGRRVASRGVVEHEHPVGASPAAGGANRRVPGVGELADPGGRPVRGSNHQAFTFGPLIMSMRTENGRPTGA